MGRKTKISYGFMIGFGWLFLAFGILDMIGIMPGKIHLPEVSESAAHWIWGAFEFLFGCVLLSMGSLFRFTLTDAWDEEMRRVIRDIELGP